MRFKDFTLLGFGRCNNGFSFKLIDIVFGKPDDVFTIALFSFYIGPSFTDESEKQLIVDSLGMQFFFNWIP